MIGALSHLPKNIQQLANSISTRPEHRPGMFVVNLLGPALRINADGVAVPVVKCGDDWREI